MYIIRYTGTRKSYRFIKLPSFASLPLLLKHKLHSLPQIWKSQKKFLYLQAKQDNN